MAHNLRMASSYCMKEIAKGMFIERRRFQCMYGICGGIIWPLTNVNIEECKCKYVSKK